MANYEYKNVLVGILDDDLSHPKNLVVPGITHAETTQAVFNDGKKHNCKKLGVIDAELPSACIENIDFELEQIEVGPGFNLKFEQTFDRLNNLSSMPYDMINFSGQKYSREYLSPEHLATSQDKNGRLYRKFTSLAEKTPGPDTIAAGNVFFTDGPTYAILGKNSDTITVAGYEGNDPQNIHPSSLDYREVDRSAPFVYYGQVVPDGEEGWGLDVCPVNNPDRCDGNSDQPLEFSYDKGFESMRADYYVYNGNSLSSPEVNTEEAVKYFAEINEIPITDDLITDPRTILDPSREIKVPVQRREEIEREIKILEELRQRQEEIEREIKILEELRQRQEEIKREQQKRIKRIKIWG